MINQKEPASKFCLKCRDKCCTSIPITPNDIKRIENLGYSNFTQELDTRQDCWTKYKIVGAYDHCIFLEAGKCSVYEARPDICRNYQCGALRSFLTNLKEVEVYTDKNFKTKKEFKETVKAGKKVRLYAPGLGSPKQDGTEFVEGPHYPASHTWYAEVRVKDGIVVSVK